MRNKFAILLVLIGLILPVNVSAANEDVINYIRDEYPEYFEVEYNEGYDVIVARTDMNHSISDKRGIESFNEGIASVIFSDEMEQIDSATDIMFIGYAEDADGVEKSEAVLYYKWNRIGYVRAIVPLVEKDFYLFATSYFITDRFSLHLEGFEEADPLKDVNVIEELVISSIGMSKDSDLPDVR